MRDRSSYLSNFASLYFDQFLLAAVGFHTIKFTVVTVVGVRYLHEFPLPLSYFLGLVVFRLLSCAPLLILLGSLAFAFFEPATVGGFFGAPP